MRYLHTMLRVRNLDAALDFYCNKLGLKETRRRVDEKNHFHVGVLAPPIVSSTRGILGRRPCTSRAPPSPGLSSNRAHADRLDGHPRCRFQDADLRPA